MFTFKYNFATNPPQWKDLPCFIQKALRGFVTESPVVYDRSFFLKKFGIIVKSPIVPYKTREFEENILTLSYVNEKPESIRHFKPKKRAFIKKFLPLYRARKEEIEKRILRTPKKQLLEEKIVYPSDERIAALSHLLGPAFVTSRAFVNFKRDVPAFLSYYSQRILELDRLLQNKFWKLKKTDRRAMNLRLIGLWDQGKMPLPTGLEIVLKECRSTQDRFTDFYKLANKGGIHYNIQLPHLGVVVNNISKRDLWRKKYNKIYYLSHPTTGPLISTKEQIAANILVRRQISANEQLSFLIPRTSGLITKYRGTVDVKKTELMRRFGISPQLDDDSDEDANLPDYYGEFADYLTRNPGMLEFFERLVDNK